MPSSGIWRNSIPRISGAFSRKAILLAGLAVLATPVAGQGPALVSGTVLRRAGGDTVPAPGARVVLHRLTRSVSGPIDSVAASRSGEFRFRFRPDTGVVYLVSASWGGIVYFSEPIPDESLSQPVSLSLLVADTSSAVALRVVARYVVLGAPDANRNRTAIDLFVIRNPSPATRVGPDSTSPSWQHVLPGEVGHSAGAPGSEIDSAAVRFEDDRVLVYAPFAPGDKQLLIEHTIPASTRSLVIPLGEGADSVQVVAEEEGVVVQGLEPTSSQVLEGRPLARWIGARPGGDITITFPRTINLERWLVPALAAGVLLVMIVALLVARRPRPVVLPSPTSAVDHLVDAIAQLDAAHRGRELSADERAAWQEQRARLKRELTAALAARQAPR